MKLFSRMQPRSMELEPITVPGLEGLEVLPYLRSRLVFAHLAAKLLAATDYDLVLVDLPQFMNESSWLDTPLHLFPALSLAIFQRQDGGLRAISFGPNDAASAAIWMAKHTAKEWRCIDDADLLNYPPDAIFAPTVEAGDDLRVWQMGLEHYFRPLWKQLDHAWGTRGDAETFFTQYRAQKVAAEVLRQHQKGRRTLLVCEYQLWWRLQETLQEGPNSQIQYIFKWQDAPGVFRVEDPYFAWEHGFLDDYPAVNLAFWNALKGGHVGDFDKIRAFENLLGEFFLGPRQMAEADRLKGANVISLKRYCKRMGKKMRAGNKKTASGRSLPLSLRRLFAFSRYLRQLTAVHQRLLPEPGTQFFHAAQAFGDRTLHRELARKFLDYPEGLNRNQINLILNHGGIIAGGLGLEVPEYDQLPSFFTGRPISSVWSRDHRFPESEELEARRRAIESSHPKLTKAEKRELAEGDYRSYIRWEVIEDFQHQAQACSHIRSLVPLLQQHAVPKKSWGSMAGGIHWKATLAAWARGEQALYVKHRTGSERQNIVVDEHTPVAFLLAPDEEIDDSSGLCIFDQNEAQRMIDLGRKNVNLDRYPKPDLVFSVFLTSRLNSYLWEDHVEQGDLTSLTTLYSKAAMGIDRYYAITRLPKQFQCRVHPSSDPELRGFPLSQKGIAWALKYAPEAVIVAARPEWRPSARLKDFAQQRGKKMVTVNLSQFRPDFLARLSRIFLLSTRLKNHPKHAEISRRFIY